MDLGDSSEDDWQEVEVPKVKETKPRVKVHIEKKKDTEKEELEKMIRLQIEREMREALEDRHKVVHLIYSITMFSCTF
jgi:alanyl-tRNA synthetase